ncbi:hypothetical protein BLNAU_4298 [Blattamonas nauphoetae]|uniref:Uncharacterized protein n=1 Tax=Blattamonas nauphoetae TaxID=2049346 RepID=A0ABQ9YA42_9EUKA|nr:hypothetical protein BLNAU_4298 [Blattamonas nauphoetae]
MECLGRNLVSFSMVNLFEPSLQFEPCTDISSSTMVIADQFCPADATHTERGRAGAADGPFFNNELSR